MNITNFTLFVKGMSSVSIYQKNFYVALAELQEDVTNYAKEFNITQTEALTNIMKLKTMGQYSLFLYSLFILLSIAYAVQFNNDIILATLVGLLYFPFIFTFFYIRKINQV